MSEELTSATIYSDDPNPIDINSERNELIILRMQVEQLQIIQRDWGVLAEERLEYENNINTLRKQLEGEESIEQQMVEKIDVLEHQLGVAMKALDYYATHLIEGGRVAVEAQAEIERMEKEGQNV